MDFRFGIVSRNLPTTSNFVEFRDSRNFMFFEAPSIGCRKTGLRDMLCEKSHLLHDSCDTCYKIREMMKMDGLDCAKYQKSRRMDMMRIKGIVNENKDKR